VEAIYRNALGRDGDAEGIAFWTNMLGNNTSRSDMVSIFVEASLVSDLTPANYPNLTFAELAAAQLRQDLITNKVTVALAFTHQLGVLSNVTDNQNPESDPAYLASIKIISRVTEVPATVQEALDFLESIRGSEDQIAMINATPTPRSSLKKTGQTVSYDTYGNEVTDGSVKDDGYYQAGVTHEYSANNGTMVTDGVTGLMWQDDGTINNHAPTWQQGVDYCEALTLGGYMDWRLPNYWELEGIVDYSRLWPAWVVAFINPASSDNYWSATYCEHNVDYAWNINFEFGSDGWDLKEYGYRVRCVRGL